MAAGGRTDRSKLFDPNKMYDVTQEELRAIQERGKMRAALRNEFQKKVTNPYRGVGGYVFDPAVQRFLSMRANHWEQFKPSPKNAAFAFFSTFVPIVLFWWLFERDTRERDRKCRRGEIAYKDRSWKFI